MKKMKLLPFIGLGLTLFLIKPHMIYGNVAFGGGSGTENDPYRLSTPEHLTELQVAVDGGNTFSGKYFALTNDIDLEGYDNDSNPNNGNFDPIGSNDKVFSGVLSGKGHGISNLRILLPNESDVGLFAHLSDEANVTSLILENVMVEGENSVGSLAGFVVNSSIENIKISGSVSGNEDIGGAIGYLSGSVVEGLSVSGDVVGEDLIGGLIGEIDDAKVSNSTFSGEVIGGYYAIGGLVGFSWMATITDSYSFAEVVGVESVGGLGGEVYSSNVERFGFCGSVKGDEMLGGIAGLIDDSVFLDVYVKGDVVGGVTVGGLVGESWSESLIERGYHVGGVEGLNRVGRLSVWQSDASKIKKFYYNLEENMSFPIIGEGYSVDRLEDVLGLITEQMTQGNVKNYMKFLDFDNVWQMTSTTPMFRWQKEIVLANTGQVQVNGKVETMVADVTIPSVSPDLVINPNLPEGSVSLEFAISNDSVSPIKLELKVFEQTTNTFNDVLPSKYDSWVGLNKVQSQDLALGLIAKEGDGWQTLTTPISYVANHSEHEIGVIKPASQVDFSFDVKHGTSFSEAKTVQYKMVFVFDLLN